MTPEQSLRFARHIAERTAKLLNTAGLVDTTRQARPLFYVWPRPNRLILAFDSLAAKNVDRVLTHKFTHRLATVLSGRRVIATNSRGIFLQIAYWPAPVANLTPRPLDLSQQPSPLHVPLGLTAQGPLWLSLPDLDAVLIGGARRMGKTRLLHGWIQALIHGGRARLVLWDGKDGVEFGRYAGAENVTVVQDLPEGLALLTGEMLQRTQLFQQAGVPALPEYIRRTGDRLPPLVLILDEVAFVSDAAQAALLNLVSRGGAYGVYPVLATQRPDAAAVKSLVKANLSTRIALPVPGVHDSLVILGRAGAEKLPKQKGRLLFTWEGRLVEAQSFRVDLPELAATPGSPATATLLDAVEVRLVQACVEHLDGYFKIRPLAELTGESHRQINTLAKRWEVQKFLTPVRHNKQGHFVSRRVTESLLQAAGLGGTVDLVEKVDLVDKADLA